MRKEYLIYKLSDLVRSATKIPLEAFQKYGVKRGLRNEDGTGVLVGLTNIGNVVGYERDAKGRLVPCEGKLFYRGYELDDLVTPLLREKRFGFEEVAYLILSGKLPDSEELAAFKELLYDNMPLDHRTIVHIIDLEGNNIMNILARCVLEMYTFDPNPDDISRDNLMQQAVSLIAKFPTIIAYAYNIYRHSVQGRSLNIRYPKENLGIAQNFLYMIKGNDYTDGSLKGPLHGGANIRVIDMFHHLKENINDWINVEEIDSYLNRILNKEAYDKSGLIYGIGHAVYTLSDPRAKELKRLAGELAKEKGREDEYRFLTLLEREGIKCVTARRKSQKPICANLDFYSGFIYEMIGLPQEIYTPIFAMARIVGWMAHRIEEITFDGSRIIRPAYKNILEQRQYKPINER